jgi:hypothetical protein
MLFSDNFYIMLNIYEISNTLTILKAKCYNHLHTDVK